ncbi:MarR family winged helix-turn-helix transcriptional regulator [Paenibacillus pinihumi]|uniref:MarR family winged helix-turn-helix transcriptional regulator n=1 Tax=Paenibacillus pinihumi TaxID=669462 RepID=UPI000427B421|nr:MarR family transcriptional regulator [Paenibacillus pinihumi]
MVDKKISSSYSEVLIRVDEAFRQLRSHQLSQWNKVDIAGLGLTQARILLKLEEEGPQKASALAEMLFVTSGAITGLADSLISQGLIMRERGEQDRRVVMLEITDAGRQLVNAIHNKRLQLMEQLVANLTEDEIQELARLLEKLTPGGNRLCGGAFADSSSNKNKD